MDNEENFFDPDLFGDDYDEIVTLLDDNGNEVNFIDIARIEHGGNTYEIMQPEELPDGVEDDEALVFLVTSDESGTNRYDIVDDEETIDAVFEKYDRLFDEAMAADEAEDSYDN